MASVVAAEILVLRTGLFHKPAYWINMVIVGAFQIPVDGWLTKLSAPIVEYNPKDILGIRFPWDIPVEDFLFGFALVTAVLLLWEKGSREDNSPTERNPMIFPGPMTSKTGGTLTDHGLPRREVPRAFDAAAASYDRLVAANPGYHAHLRLSAARLGIGDRGGRAAPARRGLWHRCLHRRAADRRAVGADHRD